MAIQTSTGLRNHLAVTGSLKSAFEGGLLKFYNGTPPATADTAVTGSLLWTVSKNGAGVELNFDPTAVNGAAVPLIAQVWQGATTAGTPTYFRLVAAADDGTLSTTQKRIQGTCGNAADSDIYLTNPLLTTDSDVDAKVLDNFAIAIVTV